MKGAVGMKMIETMHGDILVLSLAGSLLGEPDASELRKRIYEVLERGIRHIVMDLDELKVINSMGLGALVASLTSMRSRGGDLCLARLSEKVDGVLSLTRLNRVIKIYDTVQRALGAF